MTDQPAKSSPPASPLTEIGNQVKTDKATVVKSAHGYTLVYDHLFEPLQDKPLHLLELGLCIGGPETGAPASREVEAAPSLELWQNYFANAQIYGFDISDFTGFQNDRFSFRQGDCGNRADLEAISDWKTDFDVIIDDASHASYHQLLTFEVLFPRLKPGGLYIIEDTHWQPQMIERALPPCPTAQATFLHLQSMGAWPALDNLDAASFDDHLAQIEGFEVYRHSALEHMKDTYAGEHRFWHRSDTLGGRLFRAVGIARNKSPRAGLKDLLRDPVKLIVIHKAHTDAASL